MSARSALYRALGVIGSGPLADFCEAVVQELGLANSAGPSVPPTRVIATTDGLQGGGDLSINRTHSVLPDGSSIAVSAAGVRVGVIDNAQHGARGGGALHAPASGVVAGFMSAADFTKLAASPGRRAAAEILFDPSGSNTGTRFNTFQAAYDEAIAAEGITTIAISIPAPGLFTFPAGTFDLRRIQLRIVPTGGTLLTVGAGTVFQNPMGFFGQGSVYFSGGSVQYTAGGFVTTWGEGLDVSTDPLTPVPVQVSAGQSVTTVARTADFGARVFSVDGVMGFLLFDRCTVDVDAVRGAVSGSLVYSGDSSCPTIPAFALFFGGRSSALLDKASASGMNGASYAAPLILAPGTSVPATKVDECILDVRGITNTRGYQSLPNGFNNGVGTFATTNNFFGGVFVATRAINPARAYFRLSAVIAGAVFTVAVYQSRDGTLENLVLDRVASGTTAPLAAGAQTVSLALTKNTGAPRQGFITDGVYVILVGRSTANAATMEVFTCGAVNLLAANMPAGKPGLGFTTGNAAPVIPVTFDPTGAGVVPSGVVIPKVILGT